jgi:16S rRNA (adenine1518-N6/adenine1519-N6)-dimethyltransferase
MSYPQVHKAAFLVQREVAERLVAQPGTRAYGSLTVRVALAAKARILSRVKPGSFVPPPRVESAFVGLELKPQPLEAQELQEFEDLVRLAFSQRRKTLRNTLGARWPKAEVEDLLESAGVESGSRAEELGLADFLRIHRKKRGMIEGIGRIQKG